MAGFALSLLRKAVASAPPPNPKPSPAPPPEPAATARPYDPSAPVALTVEFLCAVTGREFVRDYQKTPDGHAYIGQRPSPAFGQVDAFSAAASGGFFSTKDDAELTALEDDILPRGVGCLHCNAAISRTVCPKCGKLYCRGRSDDKGWLISLRCSVACGYEFKWRRTSEPARIGLKRTCTGAPRGDSLTFDDGPGFLSLPGGK